MVSQKQHPLLQAEDSDEDVELAEFSYSDRAEQSRDPLLKPSIIHDDLGSGDHRLPESPHLQRPTTERSPSFIDGEDEAVATSSAPAATQSEPPVTWMSLPNKGQLAVLTFARLSEPLAERSLAAYMFYQLRSFNPSLPDSTISSQGGFLTAAFAAAQFLTAVWWGRAADTPWIGRKRVIMIGLLGTSFSCIGVGFSKSFVQAMVFRTLAGALNGNSGVLRTMISEIIKEKKFQSRAFLLLPMCFNIGVVIGPILGGFLADPINSFPGLFGNDSVFGGSSGVSWMKAFPYGLPNLVSSFFILLSALCVFLGLDETHKALRNRPDFGRKLGKLLANAVRKQRWHHQYTAIDDQSDLEHGTSSGLEEVSYPSQAPPEHKPSNPDPDAEQVKEAQLATPRTPNAPKNTLKRAFTYNVILTILTHFILALHISTFNALIFILLPAPRAQPNSPPPHLPFRFTGGLGLSTSRVGLATAIIGVLGFPLQIIMFPRVNAKLGLLRSYRTFLPSSAIAYILIPYLVLIPNSNAAWVTILWICLTIVLSAQVLSRTFSLPSAIILINNSAPSSEVLGTIHGVAQSVSSGARTIGPVAGGWLLGLGLKGNCVGGVWWGMAGLVGINWALLWVIKET